MKTVAQMGSFVHEIVDHAHLSPAAGSVVRTLLGGIMATGSVVLSELLRPQVDKEDLHAAEQRISHALKHDSSLDVLPETYLAMVAPVTGTLRFRSIDGSDVSKPASRCLEYLDVIRDGSCKPRDRVAVGPAGVERLSAPASSPPSKDTKDRNARKRQRHNASPLPPPAPRAPQERTTRRAAERTERKAERKKFPSPPALKKLGYWSVQIEAGDGKGTHLPLAQEIYSTQDPAYQTLGEGAWSTMFERAIERVIKHIGSGGVWLMDRGFDDIFWMNRMHALVDQYVLRLKANRLVRPGTKEATPMGIQRLAETLTSRHETRIRYVDKSTHQERYRTIKFAWAPIWIDGVAHPLYLIVAHTGRKRPMLLVTDRRPSDAAAAGELIQAYLERWGNEEATRACKQLTGLERIRVRSLAAIRRLAWSAMIAIGLQALVVLTRPRLRRAVLDRAKEFIENVRFVAYRVWRVIQKDMLRALEVRPHMFT